MTHALCRRPRFRFGCAWLVPWWLDDLLAFLLLAVVAFAPTEARADDENQRVLRVLDAAAEQARDRRVRDGVASLATGTTLLGAGVASWATPSSPGARTGRDVVGGVFVGLGSVLALGGAFELVAPSSVERLRVQHGPALRAGGSEASAAARTIGLVLGQRAATARTERRASAVVSFALGLAMASAGVALEVEAEDHGLVWLGRSLIVASAGSVAIGVGTLVVRSEEERIYDLFRQAGAREPGARGLRVVPRIGLGTVGLAGTF